MGMKFFMLFISCKLSIYNACRSSFSFVHWNGPLDSGLMNGCRIMLDGPTQPSVAPCKGEQPFADCL